MNIGFIGTGSMGSLLIEAFIDSGAVEAKQLIAFNRTISKVDRLISMYPGLRKARSNTDVVSHSDIVFLCIKPAEYIHVINEIKSQVTPEKLIVSITSPVLIRHLEGELDGKIAKIIPSITNRTFNGASLCIYGSRITLADRQWLESLWSHISEPIQINEAHTRIASDLCSCSPAFLAFFIQKLIDAAVTETGIPREQAERLASEMTLGTGRLLTSGGFSPEELQKRVAVPGGITAEGLRLLERELSGVFNALVRTTHAKYEEDLLKVERQFAAAPIDETT